MVTSSYGFTFPVFRIICDYSYKRFRICRLQVLINGETGFSSRLAALWWLHSITALKANAPLLTDDLSGLRAMGNCISAPKKDDLELKTPSASSSRKSVILPDIGPCISSNHMLKQHAARHVVRKQYDEAIALYTQAIAEDPNDEDCYEARAACFLELGQGLQGLLDLENLSQARLESSHVLEMRVMLLRGMRETLDWLLLASVDDEVFPLLLKLLTSLDLHSLQSTVAYPRSTAFQALLLESRHTYSQLGLSPPLAILEMVAISTFKPSIRVKSLLVPSDGNTEISQRIYMAVQDDDLVALRKLVYSGASVNLLGPVPGLSPVTIFATALARWNCLDFLLAQGGNVEARMFGDPDDFTPLMLAVCGANAPNRTIRTLLRHGARVHALCKGSSPLKSVQLRKDLGLGNRAMYALLQGTIAEANP